MNLAHPAHHRGLGVGVTAPNALGMGMPTGAYSSAGPTLHQRSPFAIQELLGLNHAGQETPRPAAHHHHHPAHNDSIISASTYIPRTMGVGVGCPSTQSACIGDPNPSHTFSSWRPNFMPFSTMSTMSTMSTATHPHHQSMLNLGGAQTAMHPSPGDSATGQ